jgi:hypothetical protein
VTDPYLSTAAQEAALYRRLADAAWDCDAVDAHIMFEERAAYYEARPPDEIVPLF